MSVRTSPSNTLVKGEPSEVAPPASVPVAGDASRPDDCHLLLSDPEDYLEENESLDMNLSNGARKVWLVKLPRYLVDRWLDTARLGGHKLGTVRIRKAPLTGKLQVKLVLNQQAPNLPVKDIPREYDMAILNTQVRNSYVFSEENLTKFKLELTEVAAMPEQPHLPSLPSDIKCRGPDAPDPLNRKQQRFYNAQRNGESADGAPRVFIPYIKTIPKKTNLVGKICHDCQIVPSKGDIKYSQMMSKRAHMSADPVRPKVTFLSEIPGVVQLNAGPSIKGNNSLVFLKLTTTKSRLSEGRAIRMPQKDLFDLLFRLFEEYEYWLMKGLKERTKQPELYLKELLELIANLIKKGPYTSKYNLKAEYRRLRDAERAARLGLAQEEASKEEDDDEEMEDVM